MPEAVLKTGREAAFQDLCATCMIALSEIDSVAPLSPPQSRCFGILLCGHCSDCHCSRRCLSRRAVQFWQDPAMILPYFSCTVLPCQLTVISVTCYSATANQCPIGPISGKWCNRKHGEPLAEAGVCNSLWCRFSTVFLKHAIRLLSAITTSNRNLVDGHSAIQCRSQQQSSNTRHS